MPSARFGSRLRRAFVALLFVLQAAWIPSATGQQNARVLPRNLAQLVGDAHLIVRGRVLSVASERHPDYYNLDTIVVTLQVDEVLKGKAGKQYSFRQYVMDQREVMTRLGYEPGQELVLLLLRPSTAGLSSPAGFEYGRFRVRQDANGNRYVVNGVGNVALFQGLETSAPGLAAQLEEATQQSIAAHRSGPIAYDQFKAIIRALVGPQN